MLLALRASALDLPRTGGLGYLADGSPRPGAPVRRLGAAGVPPLTHCEGCLDAGAFWARHVEAISVFFSTARRRTNPGTGPSESSARARCHSCI